MGDWYLKCVYKFRIDRNKSENTEVKLQYTENIERNSAIYLQGVIPLKNSPWPSMLNLKKIELSYRIHLKLNLSDTHISWKIGT